MKKIIIILILALTASIGYSQKIIEKVESTKGIKQIKLDLDFADEIKISCWNKDEVSIFATVSINDNEDNDVYSLEIEKSGSKLLVTSEYDDLERVSKENITIKKDKDGSTITIKNGWTVDIET